MGDSYGDRWYEEDWDEEDEDEGAWDEDDWDEDGDVGDLVEGPWDVGAKEPGEDGGRLPPEVARWRGVVDDVDTVLVALSEYWRDPKAATVWVDRLEELLARANTHGYLLPAAELAELLSRLTGEARHGEAAARARQEMGAVTLAEAVELPEPWERALTALVALTSSAGHADGSSPDERVVWLLGGTTKPGEGLSLEPRVQKRSKRGAGPRGGKCRWRGCTTSATSWDISPIRTRGCASACSRTICATRGDVGCGRATACAWTGPCDAWWGIHWCFSRMTVRPASSWWLAGPSCRWPPMPVARSWCCNWFRPSAPMTSRWP